MARSFLWECPRCRYRVAVAGGEDRAAHAITRTIHCLDCRELYDAPIRLRVSGADLPLAQRLTVRRVLNRPLQLDRPLPGWQLRLAHAGSLKRRWVNVKLRCPRGESHRIQPWTGPGACPRCSGPLESTTLPYRVWD